MIARTVFVFIVLMGSAILLGLAIPRTTREVLVPARQTPLPESLPPESPTAESQPPLPPRTVVRSETRQPPLEKIELPIARESAPTLPPSKPALPPLEEAAILAAVVKIECPAKEGGEFIGSGFVLHGNLVVTAAHVVMDSASTTCKVIFPRGVRPVHYLKGTLREDLATIKRRHDEEGIDIAAFSLPPLASFPEARAIFSEYPAVPYPLCRDSVMLGDVLLHYGYPANYADQNYLSRLEGAAVSYADITGIKEVLSEDQTYAYKTPVFSYTSDEATLHSYMVSRVASFYGDSGGLAFNAAKQCVLGPHRGGTIGREAGENFSVLALLGWGMVQSLVE